MNNYKLGENLPVYSFKFHNLISSGLAGTKISEPSWLFLMDLYHISEDEAYHRLQQYSMKNRKSLKDVAKAVISSAEKLKRQKK